MATPHTIAVAGKGGVGKTTTCGMIIDYLCKKQDGPILVVDADANSNLNEVLGVEVETTLGSIREEMAQAELKGTIPSGMTKAEYAEFKFNSALIEEDNYDMLVMGRTQGKGCYCYVNGVLKTQVDKYAKNYRYLVMDNEAGLEHVARGTLPHVDTMLPGHPGGSPGSGDDRGDGAQSRPDGPDCEPGTGWRAGRGRQSRNREVRPEAAGGASPGRGCLSLRLPG